MTSSYYMTIVSEYRFSDCLVRIDFPGLDLCEMRSGQSVTSSFQNQVSPGCIKASKQLH